MNQEKIGIFLSNLRKEKKMTQEQLAEKLNVTSMAISNWENGKRMPDYSIIMDLCKELDISLNELIIGEKVPLNDFKKTADENLLNSLKNNFDKSIITYTISIVGASFSLMLFILKFGNVKEMIFYLIVLLFCINFAILNRKS